MNEPRTQMNLLASSGTQLPGYTRKRIGIVGGGQLAMLMGIAVARDALPYELVILDPTANCPASRYAKQIVGSFANPTDIKTLASEVDVVTYEIELADPTALRNCGKQVYPSPEALETIRDKYLQKKMLREKGIAVADFMAVCDTTTLEEAIERFGIPGVLKARVGGYDGRGNVIIRKKKEVMPAYESLRQQAQGLLLFEKYVPFSKELSVIAVRDINGKIATYPVTENMHNNGILDKTILPARISETATSKAVALAINTIAAFETVGTFGIELFLTKDNEVLVNEVAPRVHNSGHCTLDAAYTSQFRNHLQAVAGHELGITALKTSSAVMINLIGPPATTGKYAICGAELFKDRTDVFVYDYGKPGVNPNGRKIGHVTILADTPDITYLLEKAENIRQKIRIEITQ